MNCFKKLVKKILCYEEEIGCQLDTQKLEAYIDKEHVYYKKCIEELVTLDLESVQTHLIDLELPEFSLIVSLLKRIFRKNRFSLKDYSVKPNLYCFLQKITEYDKCALAIKYLNSSIAEMEKQMKTVSDNSDMS